MLFLDFRFQLRFNECLDSFSDSDTDWNGMDSDFLLTFLLAWMDFSSKINTPLHNSAREDRHQTSLTSDSRIQIHLTVTKTQNITPLSEIQTDAKLEERDHMSDPDSGTLFATITVKVWKISEKVGLAKSACQETPLL